MVSIFSSNSWQESAYVCFQECWIIPLIETQLWPSRLTLCYFCFDFILELELSLIPDVSWWATAEQYETYRDSRVDDWPMTLLWRWADWPMREQDWLEVIYVPDIFNQITRHPLRCDYCDAQPRCLCVFVSVCVCCFTSPKATAHAELEDGFGHNKWDSKLPDRKKTSVFSDLLR